MTEEFLLKHLKISKDLLVYFNSFNRHLYRYTGFEILKKLFNKSLKDNEIQDVFHTCCIVNGYKLCKILLDDERVDPTFNKNIALRHATTNNNICVVELLLNDKRIEPVVWNFDLMHIVCVEGYVDIFKLLLSNNKIEPGHCIRYAAYGGFLEIVNCLLQDPRVDPSADNNIAIRYATERNHIEIVKLLLEDSRVGVEEALEVAQRFNRSELIHLLSNKKTKHLYYPYKLEHRLLLRTLDQSSEKQINHHQNLSFDPNDTHRDLLTTKEHDLILLS